MSTPLFESAEAAVHRTRKIRRRLDELAGLVSLGAADGQDVLEELRAIRTEMEAAARLNERLARETAAIHQAVDGLLRALADDEEEDWR